MTEETNCRLDSSSWCFQLRGIREL
jgi:hypothetical protein